MVIQKCEKSKKWIFSKNFLTLFVSGREKKRAFSWHYLFWPKFFGPKQCKPGNTIKIGVSAEIAQNQKLHLFFEKGVFLTWVKKWVLLTVLLKSCVFWKHYFYSVFSKHSFSKAKPVCWKKGKLWKIEGCFGIWQHGFFLGLSFFFRFECYCGLFVVCLA